MSSFTNSCHLNFLYNLLCLSFTILISHLRKRAWITTRANTGRYLKTIKDLPVSRLMMIMIMMSSSNIVMEHYKGSPTDTIGHNSKQTWWILGQGERSRCWPIWKGRSWQPHWSIVYFSQTGQFRNLWQCFSWYLFLLLCLINRFVLDLLVIDLWAERFSSFH